LSFTMWIWEFSPPWNKKSSITRGEPSQSSFHLVGDTASSVSSHRLSGSPFARSRAITWKLARLPE